MANFNDVFLDRGALTVDVFDRILAPLAWCDLLAARRVCSGWRDAVDICGRRRATARQRFLRGVPRLFKRFATVGNNALGNVQADRFGRCGRLLYLFDEGILRTFDDVTLREVAKSPPLLLKASKPSLPSKYAFANDGRFAILEISSQVGCSSSRLSPSLSEVPAIDPAKRGVVVLRADVPNGLLKPVWECESGCILLQSNAATAEDIFMIQCQNFFLDGALGIPFGRVLALDRHSGQFNYCDGGDSAVHHHVILSASDVCSGKVLLQCSTRLLLADLREGAKRVWEDCEAAAAGGAGWMRLCLTQSHAVRGIQVSHGFFHVEIRDVKKGTLLRTLPQDPRPVRDSFARLAVDVVSGRMVFVVSGSQADYFTVWDLRGLQPRARFASEACGVADVSLYGHMGLMLVHAASELRVYDLERLAAEVAPSDDDSSAPLRVGGFSSIGEPAAASPDGGGRHSPPPPLRSAAGGGDPVPFVRWPSGCAWPRPDGRVLLVGKAGAHPDDGVPVAAFLELSLDGEELHNKGI